MASKTQPQRILAETGTTEGQGDGVYETEVLLNGKCVSTTIGRSKKEAASMAVRIVKAVNVISEIEHEIHMLETSESALTEYGRSKLHAFKELLKKASE